MSSAGQIVGGIVGAVVGFFVGGPVGAIQGAAIGAGIGSALDPPKGPEVRGPRLEDLAIQTSTYGAFIPRIYGTIAINGNVFWLENNQIMERARKKSSGGKGGGSSTTVTTYTYYATLAVGLCEGPIGGIRRIWAGPNLIYDAGSDDLESIIASNQAAEGFDLYLGTADQQPNSRMQADLGVDNTSAHIGLAYIVVRDFALQKYGNAIPGFKVEVVSLADNYELPMFAEIAYSPDVQAYFPGRPGGYNDKFTFAGYFFGATTAWRMSRSGVLSLVSPPASGLSLWAVQVNAMQAMDSHDYLYIHATDNTEELLFLSQSGWSQKSTPYNLSNFRYYERSGHMWFQWYEDSNNPGVNPTGSWMAKVYDLGELPGLQYSTRIDGGTLTDYGGFVPMIDGNILGYSCSIGAGLAGSLAMSYRDESGSTVGAFSVAIDARNGQLNSNFSCGYQANDGRLHLLFMLYRDITPLPSEYGKFYYVQIDIYAGQIIKQAEIYFPEYAVIGRHIDPSFITEEDGIIYIGAIDPSLDDILYAAFAHTILSEDGVPLAGVLRSEAKLSNYLDDSDIITTGITDTVTGYRVAAIGAIRNAIEPLRGAFPLDVIQSGYQLKFMPRGQSSVATIDIGELGVEEQLRQVREMDTQLPRKVAVKYLDRGRNYDANEQYWERPGTDAVNTRTLDLPIALGASQAAQAVERLGYLYWLERVDFGPFDLPPTYGHLEPADVIIIDAGYATYELRLTTINYKSDGSLSCTAKLNNAAVYESFAESDEVPDGAVVALPGESEYLLLDIPVVDDTLQNAPGITAVMTGESGGWPGGAIYRTGDGGQTWVALQAFDGKCTFGPARDALASNSGRLIQRSGSLTIDLLSGELVSLTEDQMLTGANIAAYGADGRWEIIRFQNAVLNGDGSYTISTFVRGDKGTEWATGLHVAGDSFVLLDDPDGAFVGMQTELIGAERDYRGVTAGADIDSDTSAAFTYQGVNLEPLSGVLAQATRDGSSNLSATFVRRSRLSSTWWTNGIGAVVGETTESYEIDVMNGSTVARTITATTPAFSYSAANQTTDFGSPQASITFRIYQLSELVGRGYVYQVTL